MKNKVIYVLLIVTSLFGYLEWGGGNHMFLIEAEGEIIGKLFTDPKSVMHPFILLPLLGQLCLLVAIFQRKPSNILVYTGIICLGILLLFMLFIGAISWNTNIILSTLPYIFVCIYALRHIVNHNKKHENK